MTTMLDKLIEAIMDSGPVGCCTIAEREAKEIARAALQAIRDAGPTMIEAGMDGCGPVGCCNIEQDNVREVWTSMIDAILEEKPE